MSNQSSLPQHDNTANLNLDNIQGDVLVALPKAVEEYTFLKITNPERFRFQLTRLAPLVTTSTQAIAEREKIKRNKEEAKLRGEKAPLLPIVGLTVGFSQTGLDKIGKNGSKGGANDLGDDAFRDGMKADSKNLGDPFNPNDPKDPKWLPTWKNGVDFMVDISGDSWERVARRWYEIEEIFGIGTHQTSVEVVIKIKCNERPGKEKGHEHFGFRDGISQPAVEGFHKPLPGQLVAPPRVFLMGQEGSPKTPEWSRDGTFLAFRHLEQLVPEFDHFLKQNPIVLPGLDRKQGSELRGARFMGRWKSGAPIELSPHHDDPKLAADLKERNNFVYTPSNDQTKCPFAAHIRKCNPRNDLEQFGDEDKHLLSKLLLRRGMPFGCEVKEDERLEHKTKHSRGLAFAAYNSSIMEGFRFVQRGWCNNPGFPPLKTAHGKSVKPGYDPIVGERGNESRSVNGTDKVKPEDPDTDMTLPFDFVVPKGGEYFFIPSIATLRDEFATKDEH